MNAPRGDGSADCYGGRTVNRDETEFLDQVVRFLQTLMLTGRFKGTPQALLLRAEKSLQSFVNIEVEKNGVPKT
jgi:hypothetical protein